jgi:hypothetical protein
MLATTIGPSIAGIRTLTRTRIALALVFMLAPFAPASAQSDTPSKNRFALGADFKIKTSDRASKEDYARGQLGPGLLWRFGTSKTGWGIHWGLPWYSVKLERPIGGNVTELGELKIRPFMAGYGYTRVIRRYSITADVLGGYGFSSINLSDPAIAAYRSALGVPTATASATNTLVLKPEIGMWYDVTKKIFFNLNAGYMVARPDVVVETAAGNDVRTARADQFIIKVGIVYSLF